MRQDEANGLRTTAVVNVQQFVFCHDSPITAIILNLTEKISCARAPLVQAHFLDNKCLVPNLNFRGRLGTRLTPGKIGVIWNIPTAANYRYVGAEAGWCTEKRPLGKVGGDKRTVHWYHMICGLFTWCLMLATDFGMCRFHVYILQV